VRRDEGEFQELAPHAPGAGEPKRGRGRGSIARIEAGIPEIRPRRVGEILDVAMEVFRSRFGTYVGLSTLLWLPVYVAQTFLVVAEWTPGDAPFQTTGFFLGFLATLFATGVVSVLDNAIVARLVADELGGRGFSVAAAVKNALSRCFAIAVIAVVNSTMTTLACFCMVLPGVLVAWRVSLAPAVCVIEDAGIVEASRAARTCAREVPPLARALHRRLPPAPALQLGRRRRRPARPPRDRAPHAGVGLRLRLRADRLRVPLHGRRNGVPRGVVAIWYYDCRAHRRHRPRRAARAARAELEASHERLPQDRAAVRDDRPDPRAKEFRPADKTSRLDRRKLERVGRWIGDLPASPTRDPSARS
jgi:hypothetical protein